MLKGILEGVYPFSVFIQFCVQDADLAKAREVPGAQTTLEEFWLRLLSPRLQPEGMRRWMGTGWRCWGHFCRDSGLQAPPFLAMCKFLAFRALGDVDPAERPGELFSLRRALLITVLNHLCILFLGNDENVI